MGLTPGSRLGSYEILSPLGAGGMGEVYKARDTRLDREVAVKVLPEAFFEDRDAVGRFEREAKALAALNHPGIASVHSYEEIGGRHVLVQELLEGETLRQALATGPPPIRKAIDWAIQIARGLSAAHEKGIVHRDLKPENLFVTKDGRIKILDFGLAKLTEGGDEGASSAIRTEARGTEPGVVLGTLGDLSPEPVRGRPADARSDLFSFGAVLYEMLAGRKAFTGDSGADVITSILREEPPELTFSNRHVPAGLERIVRRCLEKAPAQRFQSSGDLAFALESLSTDSAARADLPRASSRPGLDLRRAAVVLGATGLIAAGYFAGPLVRRPAHPVPSLLFERLTNEPGVERSPTLSPDGETVAYVKAIGGRRHVFVQRVGSEKATDLSSDAPDSDGDPAFSPDGALIAFRSERDGGGIFIMGPLGESVRRVTDSGFDPDWTPDGKEIVYADEAAESPLSRGRRSLVRAVEVATGRKRVIFGPDAVDPAVSPHGLRVAFWGLKGDTAQRDVYTAPLAGLGKGEKATPVTDDPAVDFSPFWSPDGAFLYFGSDRGGSFNLWRIPIDEASGRTRGTPEPVTLPITWAGFFPGSFRGARNGKRIAFTAPAELMSIEKLTLEPGTFRVAGPPAVVRRSSTSFDDLHVSPDGATLATRTVGRIEDLCLLSADGLRLSRLTRDAFRNRAPVFTPDGRHLVFYSSRGGDYRLFSVAADGSGVAPLTPEGSPYYLYPAISPDGRFVAAASWDARVAVFPLVSGAGGTLSTGPATSEFESRWPWAWSPDSRSLVAAAPEGDLVQRALLCTPETKRCEDLGVRAFTAQFAPDGRTVLLSTPDGIRAVNTATRASRLLYPVSDDTVQRLALSRDGRSLYFLRDVTEGDIWVGTFR